MQMKQSPMGCWRCRLKSWNDFTKWQSAVKPQRNRRSVERGGAHERETCGLLQHFRAFDRCAFLDTPNRARYKPSDLCRGEFRARLFVRAIFHLVAASRLWL